MKIFRKAIPYFVYLSTLTGVLFSCIGSTGSQQEAPVDSIESAETSGPIDYESPEQLAKFVQLDSTLPDTLTYYHQLLQIKWGKGVNYVALDSFYAAGLDINATIHYRGGGGFGFKFSFSQGIQQTRGGVRDRETTALKIALREYHQAVTYGISWDDTEVNKHFDLIHFLLSRGADPNTQALETLHECVGTIANDFNDHGDHLEKLLDVYTYYGFDIANLDLSACANDRIALRYLIQKGAHTYTFSDNSHDADVGALHSYRDSLAAWGIQMDYSHVSGSNFPFVKDTLRLRQYLELGLPPNHVTPEGIRLYNDLGPFHEELFQGVIDDFVREQKNPT